MESRYESIQRAIRAASLTDASASSVSASDADLAARAEQRRVAAEIARAGAVLSPQGAAQDLNSRLSRSVAELSKLLELVPGGGGGGGGAPDSR
jgi:hypothetical protein